MIKYPKTRIGLFINNMVYNYTQNTILFVKYSQTILTNNQFPPSFIIYDIWYQSDTPNISLNTSYDSNACVNQFDNDKFIFVLGPT